MYSRQRVRHGLRQEVGQWQVPWGMDRPLTQLANYSRAVVLQFRIHQNHLEGLLEHKFIGFTSRVSDLVGVGWGAENCLSNTSPDDGDLLVQGPPLEKNCSRESREEVSSHIRSSILVWTWLKPNSESQSYLGDIHNYLEFLHL